MPGPSRTSLLNATNCLNYRLRRTTRLVSQYYDRALRPAGIRVGQFNLMIPVALRGALSITQLADLLGLERSALARSLRPLQRRGWLRVTVGADRRARIVRLTPSGRRLLRRVYPLWEQAQTGLAGALSRSRLQNLLTGLRAASLAVHPED